MGAPILAGRSTEQPELTRIAANSGPLCAVVDPDHTDHDQARQELKRLARDKQEGLVACPTLPQACTLLSYLRYQLR